MASSGDVEQAKKAAAEEAVNVHVKSGMVVGIGSGSTVVYAVAHLARLVADGALHGITCVPTSFQAIQLVSQAPQLVLSSLVRHPELDVTIDGADEVEPHFAVIKGGGGCLFQEKIVAYNSKKLVIITDSRKRSPGLGQVWKAGVPVEVSALAYRCVEAHIRRLTAGEPRLRMSSEKCGPVVTDNGNFIFDVQYTPSQLDYARLKELNAQLLSIPGLIETGLFIDMVSEVFYGNADGSVLRLPEIEQQ